MKRHTKFLITGLTAVLMAVTLTGCATKEEKEAAAKFQAEAEKYTEGNNYEAAQASMKKALKQTPKDKELQAASEELNAKAKKMNSYSKTMEAAIAAIEADNAQALNELQESDTGKALDQKIGEVGSYIYMPKGGKSGKGIGFYSFEGGNQWYYGDYKDAVREGSGIWYFVNKNTEDEGVNKKEVYTGEWSKDKPNGTGHQYIEYEEKVYKDQDYTVKDGLFYGTYDITDKLEDGTEVTGSYTLKDGKYEVISDEELTANNFAIPEEAHLAIAFLYDAEGNVRSCAMIFEEDATEGVAHFR